MRTIWKYELDVTELDVTGRITLQMPAGAIILPFAHAVSQVEINIWAEVNTCQPKEPRKITVIGTGHSIDPADYRRLDYLSSVVAPPFVWHVYELDGATHA